MEKIKELLNKIKFFLNEEVKKLTLKEVIIVLMLLVIYSFISFYKLGDTKAVNTFEEFDTKDELVIDLAKDEYIKTIKFYTGRHNAFFKLYVVENGDYTQLYKNEQGLGAFTWNEIDILSTTSKIKLEFKKESDLGEIAFLDENDKIIKYNITKKLNDEQELVPSKPSYLNTTYFDEVYFARTAYEYVNKLDLYEWTHPPLGKLIQAIPIYLTNNMSPFNYRFMSNISGIHIIGVMYVFGVVFFKKRKYALLSSIIMMLDNLHLAHTRMGTVDPHLVLFIMLANLFMVIFTKKEELKYLILSGIFFALSISIKWIGFYGGIGLAIIYFTYIIKNKKFDFKKYKSLSNYKYILYGFSFFVFIPLIIYSMWFFLFPNYEYKTNTISGLIKENQKMYNYHANLDSDHFFSSKWYTWPIDYKPVWLYVQDKTETTKESISNVGNLVIWLVGIVAFLTAIIKIIRKKDKNSYLLVVTILGLFLPYIFIGRIMFLYHYYPILPFLFLLIVGTIKDIKEKYRKIIVPIFLTLALIFFIIYYPVSTGLPMSNEYFDKIALFDTWYF